MIVPADASAPKVTSPVPHLDAGETPVIVGFALITKFTAALQFELPEQAA
ncbi:hypothetical protein NU08_3819 [Flavobacterium anhuiense]|uniref:Uncharacterized protein n=1 Tax=Flavobacterium anhuiense TaxID=459526 RepID=A0A444VV01_9FLAO|nr:hypothetical protein NU08_3819 [Flavobacterium anhuiense]